MWRVRLYFCFRSEECNTTPSALHYTSGIRRCILSETLDLLLDWEMSWGKMKGNCLFLPAGCQGEHVSVAVCASTSQLALTIVCLSMEIPDITWISASYEEGVEYISFNQVFRWSCSCNYESKGSLQLSLWCGFPLCRNCSLLNIPHMFFFHQEKAVLICLSL